MSREFRDFVLKGGLEEKALNYDPGYYGHGASHRPARRGGSILPKRGGQRALMRRAQKLSKIHRTQAGQQSRIRAGVNPNARRTHAGGNSPAQQHRALGRSINQSMTRANRLDKVAAYLKRRTSRSRGRR